MMTVPGIITMAVPHIIMTTDVVLTSPSPLTCKIAPLSGISTSTSTFYTVVEADVLVITSNKSIGKAVTEGQAIGAAAAAGGSSVL